MSTPITPHDFPEIRWYGHWIWVPEEPIAPSGFLSSGVNPHARESHGLFRKTLHLDHVPDRVPVRITADSRYALFVNGQEVFRGPIRSQPRRMYYDLFDLAPYLRPGQNVLAIYVKYYGRPTSYWMPAAPNLTLGRTGVLVFEADLGAAGWLVSDATWKAKKAGAWDDSWRADVDDPLGGGVPVEVFDARRMPHSWRADDFDDHDWGAAQLVPAMHIGGFARTQPPTDPYGPLLPRPIARLSGTLKTPARVRVEALADPIDITSGSPVWRVATTHHLPIASSQTAQLPLTVDVPAGGAQRIVLDMGVVVSGLVQFELSAPVGTVLDITYLEEPLKGLPRPGGTHAGTRYIARGTNDRMEVFDSNGFRYAYLLVHGVAGAVTLTSFAVQEQLYPWQAGASFSCDDEELNRLYMAGIRTVQLNSHDAFIDCPTREQRAWVGDAVVHQMVHLATNQDWRLAWHYLSLADSPRSDGSLPMSVVGEIEAGGGYTIPDWALHWVHGVYNCYRFSGDQETVKALMPSIERVLRWYVPYQTSAGVLQDVPEWNLVDWSSVYVSDTSALLTALWARGLREFAEMAAWLEERGSQRWAERLYERARHGFEIFWDERRGSYVDHIVGGEQQPEMSQLAGALAIVSGLAPQERWGRIVDTITDASRLVVRSWTGGLDGDYSQEKMEKQFRGIYETDWDAEREIVIAEPFMSYTVHDAVALAGRADRLPDLYPRWSQFLVDGYDTLGECWGWGTHVHGWSSTPTRDMIFYTLGVTPAAPGYTSARIAPRLGRLTSAQGRVPTPHGLISVSVTGDSVTIDSPVPIIVDLEDQPPRALEAGQHQLARETGRFVADER
ncbi:MAG TPA: alpha-L-rhamnosidase N-terminal domain-containing protein [Herpetosiphonaceae bacterium]